MQVKNALIIIARGSPVPNWRKPVLDLKQIVRQELTTHPVRDIDYMCVALMECTEPSATNVIKNCLEQGAGAIFALPLFIAPSSHTEEDLPNIPGMKYNRYVYEELAEEDAEIVHTNVPIVMRPTFYYSHVLEKTMLQRMKTMSKDGENKAVIFLAHDDPEHTGFWDMILEHVQKYIKDNSKITYIDAQQIEMGHDLANELLSMLKRASQHKKRILVQGIYLTSDVRRMTDRHNMQEKQAELTKDGVGIIYSNEGILPVSSDLIANWVIGKTTQWLKSKKQLFNLIRQ